MRRAGPVLALLALAGLAVAQGEPRRWPVSATERLALEALDARERALAADRDAFARDVARRLGVAPEGLRLERDRSGAVLAWTETVAPVRSGP